jgi:hypothetical protein
VHLCSPNANIFICSYLSSLPDSLLLIQDIDGDASSGAPMSQKVLFFSQQRMILTMTWNNVMKITVHFNPR